MTIADRHRLVADKENPVRSATSTPFNVAAQRICHLYGSFGSKKIPTPSKAPSTTPIRITVRKFIARSCDLTGIRLQLAIYFCLYRGQSVVKRCRLARPALTLELLDSEGFQSLLTFSCITG